MNITAALISAGSSIIVGVLALLGVIITNNRSNHKMQNKMVTSLAVTDERLDELTREVREHNNFARRIPVIEEKLNGIERRVHALEKYHGPN